MGPKCKIKNLLKGTKLVKSRKQIKTDDSFSEKTEVVTETNDKGKKIDDNGGEEKNVQFQKLSFYHLKL